MAVISGERGKRNAIWLLNTEGLQWTVVCFLNLESRHMDFFGGSIQLAGSQFPEQGLNPGHGS